MKETWRDIKGYEGHYQVSSFGRVKRLKTSTVMRNQVTSWIQELPERLFVPTPNTQGYLQVGLLIGGNKRVARVHRLVAEHFLVPPSQNLVKACEESGLKYVMVNHIDGDIRNNRCSNLEWCNAAYNLTYAIKGGRKTYQNMTGESNQNNILKEQDVLEIVDKYMTTKISQQKLGEIYGVKQITISNILTGKSWHWLTGIEFSRKSYKKRNTPVNERDDVH